MMIGMMIVEVEKKTTRAEREAETETSLLVPSTSPSPPTLPTSKP